VRFRREGADRVDELVEVVLGARVSVERQPGPSASRAMPDGKAHFVRARRADRAPDVRRELGDGLRSDCEERALSGLVLIEGRIGTY
jgi:hypothetical protein